MNRVSNIALTVGKRFLSNSLKLSKPISCSSIACTKLIQTDHADIVKSMVVCEDFLSIDEENSLFDEIEPYIKRLRYEFDHWDDAIHGYRESERTEWNTENKKILNRVKQFAFDSFQNQALKDEPNHSSILSHVHILDLHQDGFIKPHIDAVRFCGNTIAGLSLLSDSVMKLTHETDPSRTAHVLLKRRSLYIMKDEVRFNYKHEILKNAESFFLNQKIQRERRISVICRNKPQ